MKKEHIAAEKYTVRRFAAVFCGKLKKDANGLKMAI